MVLFPITFIASPIYQGEVIPLFISLIFLTIMIILLRLSFPPVPIYRDMSGNPISESIYSYHDGESGHETN